MKDHEHGPEESIDQKSLQVHLMGEHDVDGKIVSRMQFSDLVEWHARDHGAGQPYAIPGIDL